MSLSKLFLYGLVAFYAAAIGGLVVYQWEAVLDSFIYGLGVAYGLLIVGSFSFLKQVVLESAFEWAHEMYEQKFVRPVEAELRSSKYPPGTGEIVIVSDLHIDTWDSARGGRPKREEDFLSFLKAIEQTSGDLFINGDLLDAPPNPRDKWEGEGVTLKASILPKYEHVLSAIWEINNIATEETGDPLTVTFVHGNHDMVASGVRYDLVRRPKLLKLSKVPFNKMWYPNLILGVPYDPETRYGHEQYRFFVDHGHFYDPVLLLYLRDFLLAALRADVTRALTSVAVAGQRRTGEDQEIPQPGIAPTGKVTFDKRVGNWIVKYRWRWKARRTLIQRNSDEVKQGHNRLSGVLFGHTHSPDYYVFRTGEAAGMTYVNTGDWAGNTGHGTYTIITQDGVVRQFDWVAPNRRAPHHMLERTG